MFFSSLYKKILDTLPTAVIVCDRKGCIRFTNAAFRRYFPSAAGRGKKLKDVVGCAERACGKGAACASCRLKRLFDGAAGGARAQSEDIPVSLTDGGRRREVSLRIYAVALDQKHSLGLVESVYEQELVKELNNAHFIQQRLLPAGKEAGGVAYAYMYLPCREIGGDLPDVYELDCGGVKNTFGVLADVSGKGIAAGMLSSFVRAGFDRDEPSPARALRRLDAKFRDMHLDEKSYITVAAVRIDAAAQKIHYCIAGHNAPLLLRSGENVSEIEMAAPPVSNWFDPFLYEDGQMEYRRGDILVLLTDGVTESRNAAGELFGIERVENILLRSDGAQRFIESLQSALKEFCGGSFEDDITAIAFDL